MYASYYNYKPTAGFLEAVLVRRVRGLPERSYLMDSRRRLKCKFAMFKIMDRRKFWLGGAAPQTPQFLAGGAKPPQTP